MDNNQTQYQQPINNIQTEENKPPKKSNTVLIIIAIILFIIGCVGGFILGQSLANKEDENKENTEEKQEDTPKEPTEEELTDESIKEKLNSIIEKIYICPLTNGDKELLTGLLNGKKELTNEEKFAITLRYVDSLREMVTESEVPKELKDQASLLAKITYYDYENKYKEIFIDTPVIDEQTMKGLDMPSSVAFFNNDKQIMYVHTGYGGICSYEIVYEKYSTLEEKYIVYTTLTNVVDDNQATSNIKWIFDKDLRFIETQVVE